MSGKGGVSQAFIARSLGLSGAAITKLKKQGMPVDSVEAALAWREQRLNIAARKPTPGPAKSETPKQALPATEQPLLNPAAMLREQAARPSATTPTSEPAPAASPSSPDALPKP